MVTTIKGLRSSLREKKRYLVYECLSEQKLEQQAITMAVRQALFAFLGEYGYGRAGVILLKQRGNKGIIRANTRYVDHVRTALMHIKSIASAPAIVRTVGVSGMLNKSISKFM